MIAEVLQTLRSDLLYAVRLLRKNPVFTATALVTLALAIGANTAIFTIIRAVLLEPLPYPASNRLMRLAGGATPARYRETQAAARSFLDIGAFTLVQNLTLSGIREPQVLRGVSVSSNFLRILGVRPLLGREFSVKEDSAGGNSVAMISAELWRRLYAADPNVIGRTAVLDAADYTIIGVLPERFQFPSPGLDVWTPAPTEVPSIPLQARTLSPYLTLFGRLEPGANVQQANARLRVIRRQYAMAHPARLDAKAKSTLELTPLKDDLVGRVRSMLWLLFGAVSFVLLIACSNIASLLLTRVSAREQELALRCSLGASRTRLISQLLIESVLLSALGGVGGAFLTVFCVRALPHLSSFQLPRAEEISVNWAVFAFAAGASMLSGFLSGFAPALQASRPDLIRALRASGQAAGSSRPARWAAFRNFLSVVQVALSTVLLLATVLLVTSAAHLRNVPVGFNPDHLLIASISLPPLRYKTDQQAASFFEILTERLRALPGVRGAAAAMFLPMMNFPGIPVQDAAKPKLRLNERLIAKYFPVTPEYFQTLQIRLTRGREFNQHDTADAQRVAIINESLARHLWPAYPRGLDPVGQKLLVGGINPNPAEIVGVAKDVKQNLDDRQAWQETVYVSFLQSPDTFAVLAIRTAGSPLSYARSVRQQVWQLDRDQSVAAPETMEALIDAQVGDREFLSRLLLAFAATAVLLAVTGLYGLVAYSVTQRVQEIGVRRALGAQASDIIRLVIAQGAMSAVLGITLGTIGGLFITRFMQAQLFEVSPADPATFLAVALTFLMVSVLASYLPARAAANIDPMAALRL